MITQELVEKLKTPEWDALKRFIKFRYPRLRPDVLRCLEAFQSNVGKQLSRQEIHSLLFGQKSFNDKTIRYLLTDINRLISEYYSYIQVTKSASVRQLSLLRELSDRGCTRAFEKTYNQELKALNQASQIDASTLHYRYELHSLKAKTELDSGKRSSDVFEDSSHYLDHYFVAKKLQISAEKINLHFILNKSWDDAFLETILHQIDAGFFADNNYITLYRSIILSLTQPDNESVFESLKKDAPLLQGKISDSEFSDLYQYLLNYCIRRINAGRLVFQDELLSVYQDSLTNEALFSNGRLSQWDFKNVVTIALRTKNLEYAREFIHSYKQFLPSDQRVNALAYNLANLHFSEGDYRAAIKQLQRVDLDDLYYRLDARSILLKSYYELDDGDALFYHATAFRSMLNRNRKISDQQRKLYLNLIKHTLSLFRCAGEGAKVRTIKNRIAKNRSVADLSWLEAKLAAFGA